jgi:Zn ribbon nucleic-acid-binding protein
MEICCCCRQFTKFWSWNENKKDANKCHACGCAMSQPYYNSMVYTQKQPPGTSPGVERE